MSTDRQDKPETLEPGGSDELFERLFKLASPRPRPPEADEKYLREVLHAEWDEVMGRRVARKRMTWLAAAASVLVVLGSLTVALRSGMQTPPAIVLASVEKTTSGIRIRSAGDGAWQVASEAGIHLYSGQTVAVPGDGGIAVRFLSGGVLRAGKNTRLELLDDHDVRLLDGSLYFDSRTESGESAQLTLRTDFGVVSNVGTQFAARLNRHALRVRVREGQIQIDQGGNVVSAARGERLTVRGTGDIDRDTAPIYGETWRWAEGLVPTFNLEGRTCIDFLHWVARETGRRLEFDSPEVERIAGGYLHGGKIEQEPLLALAPVLSTCNLHHRVEGETIYIMPMPESGEWERRTSAIINAREAQN